MGMSGDCSVSPKSESHPFESISMASISSRSAKPASQRNSAEAPSPSNARLFTRTRPPPRNTKDQIYCDHDECATKEPTFARKCEWDKHMDKHERPYTCKEPGCERLLGFTYSGGLLRHQREVHKMNISTKKALYCPFPHCNRNESSGNGFTRLENLSEHKRRRHTGETLLLSSGFPPITERPNASAAVPIAIPRQYGALSTPVTGRKRRRVGSSGALCSSDSEDETGQFLAELQAEIRQLRQENSEQAAEIQRLKKEIQDIKGRLPLIKLCTDIG